MSVRTRQELDEFEARAREFINDCLKINAEHGMRNVEVDEIIEAAVAKAAKWARTLANLGQGHR